jgi:hypothetical protein
MLYHHTVVTKEWSDVHENVLCRTTFAGLRGIGMQEKMLNVNKILFNVCSFERIVVVI